MNWNCHYSNTIFDETVVKLLGKQRSVDMLGNFGKSLEGGASSGATASADYVATQLSTVQLRDTIGADEMTWKYRNILS
jgi:hypothetical protein